MKSLLSIALFTAFFMACKTDTSNQKPSTETKADTPMASESKAEVKTDSMPGKTYVCPMHPEVTSTKEGEKCPKCGMDLVIKDK